jgi:hypothetical protein
MKKRSWVIILAVLSTLTFCVTCLLFDSPFAESTVDWFSFFAGIFLAIEGIYKIRKFKGPLFPGQFMRTFRIMIGTSIFIGHLIMFIWGVNCKALEAPFTQAAMDWFVFFSGIFLVVEGTCRILTAKAPLLRDQIMRTVRVVIGACIFTIHLLQFMRY